MKNKDKFVVNTSELTDGWAQATEQLQAASQDQASADIRLVEAQRAHAIAEKNLLAAVKSKTLAEKRLNTLRARLGVERCMSTEENRDRPRFETSILIEDSDWIDSIQYDTETQVLDMRTREGDKYRYRDVHPLTFARVVTAKSSGKAFNEYVKPLKHKKLPGRR